MSEEKGIVSYITGSVDKVVSTIVVGTDKVVTKVVTPSIIVSAPVKAGSISSVVSGSGKAEGYKRVGSTEGESGDSSTSVDVDLGELINRLQSLFNALDDLYWKLYKRGIPESVSLMRSIWKTRKKLYREILYLEELEKRDEKLDSTEYSSIEDLINKAEDIKSKAFAVAYHNEPITFSDPNSLLKDNINYYLSEIGKYRAFLYSIAPLLKEETFNTLKNMLSEAENVLKKYRDKSLENIDPSKDADLFKYLAFLRNFKDDIMFRVVKDVNKDITLTDNEKKTVFEILSMDKAVLQEYLDKYKELKEKYDEECSVHSRGELKNKPYCASLDTFLKHEGFPFTSNTMELFMKYRDYYEKIMNGEKVSVNPATEIRWTMSKALDTILQGPFIVIDDQKISDELHEKAMNENDPIKKMILESLSIAVPWWKSANIGAYWFMLSILTGGLSDVALAVAGFTKLADDLSYMFSDPEYKDAIGEFADKLKNKDPEAWRDLMIMLGSLGMFLATYKGLDKIKVGDVSLREYIQTKLSEKLYGLSDKLLSKGMKKLSEIVKKIADKYAPKLEVGVNATTAGQERSVDVKIEGRKATITITEKGKVVYQDTVEIPIRPDYTEVFEQFGYNKEKAIQVLQSYISKVIHSVDDIKKLDEYFGVFDDLLEKAKNGKIAPDTFKKIIESILSRNTQTYVIIDEKVKFKGLAIEQGDGVLELYTGNPESPLVKLTVQLDTNEPLNPVKKVKFEGASNLDDAIQKLGLKDTSDFIRIVTKALSDPHTSMAVLQVGEDIITFSPTEYKAIAVVTPKGYYEATTGDGIIVKIQDDVVKIPRGKFESHLFVDPDGKYIMKSAVTIKIKDLSKILEKIKSLSKSLKYYIDSARDVYRETGSIDKAREVIDHYIEKICKTIAETEGVSENAVMNSLGDLRQVMISLIKTSSQTSSSALEHVTLIPMGIITEQGAALTLSLALPSAASEIVSETLSKQEAEHLILEAKQKLGLSEEDTITASQVANALGIPVETAQKLLEKAEETSSSQEQEIIVVHTTKIDYVEIPENNPVTVEKTVEEQLLKTVDKEIPVITSTYTDLDYMTIRSGEKHMTLSKEATEQLVKTIDKEIPEIQQHVTDTRYQVIGQEERRKTIVVENTVPLKSSTTGKVVEVVVPVIKEITVTVPVYKEVFIPITEQSNKRPQPEEKPQPAPPLGLPPIPSAGGGGITLTPPKPRRGKQYETIRL